MNKKTAREYLPLIQALIDGKTIQISDGAGWVDMAGNIVFDQSADYYRVKPEAIEFDMWVKDRERPMYDWCYGTAWEENMIKEGWRKIRVREVRT